MSTRSALSAMSAYFPSLVHSVEGWKNFRQDGTFGMEINSWFLLPTLFKGKGGEKKWEVVNSTLFLNTRLKLHPFAQGYFSLLTCRLLPYTLTTEVAFLAALCKTWEDSESFTQANRIPESLRRSLIQPPVQSRTNSEIRQGCSVLSPMGSWKLPRMKPIQPHWATCPVAWLSSQREIFLYELLGSTF